MSDSNRPDSPASETPAISKPARLKKRLADWFFGGGNEDGRLRHETLESRILYSASPVEEPQAVEAAPVVADAAGNASGSGDGGGGGPAPAVQDQTPQMDVETIGAGGQIGSGDIADILDQVGNLDSGEVERLSNEGIGAQFKIQGTVDWNRLEFADGESVWPVVVMGGDDTDDLLILDLSQVSSPLDLYFDGGMGGYDTLRISGVTTGSYTPGDLFGDGTLIFGNHRISFSGLEPVIIEGTGLGSSFTFTTPHGADDLRIDSPVDGWSRIQGTSGGVAFEELIFSNLDEVILDAFSNDVPGGSPDRVVVESAIQATGLRNFEILTGAGDDTLVIGTNSLAPPVAGGTFTFDSGGGSDRIIGSGADTTWFVTGHNEGRVQGIRFRNVESLEGAADNEDRFVFEAGARLDGMIDGGALGFDTLVLDGGTSSKATFTAYGPDAGLIETDLISLSYRGLEPIDYLGSADAVINLTTGVDEAILEDNAGTLRLRSQNGSFELINFINPLNSLVVNAGDGRDQITVATGVTMNLTGQLAFEAETITVAAGATLSAGSIRFTATDDESSTVPVRPLVDLSGAIPGFALGTNQSGISVLGNSRLVSEGDIILEAAVNRNIAVLNPLAVVVVGGSVASVSLSDDASLEAVGAITISAETRGSVQSGSFISAVVNYDETAMVDTGNAHLEGASLVLEANTNTQFITRARAAINNVSGDTRVTVGAGSLNFSGDITLTAKDSANLTAQTPEGFFSGGVPAGLAINNLDRSVEASVSGADIDVTGDGTVTIDAS
ncbi:MAG: LEPR-XLL domain-containing protein [Verrucomicrobiales bacterium]